MKKSYETVQSKLRNPNDRRRLVTDDADFAVVEVVSEDQHTLTVAHRANDRGRKFWVNCVVQKNRIKDLRSIGDQGGGTPPAAPQATWTAGRLPRLVTRGGGQ